MSLLWIVSIVVVGGYLLYAMLRPERF